MIAHNQGDDIDLRLDQLLERWEEFQQHGETCSPEELCSTCPELAGELARRIALLRAFDPLLTDSTIVCGDHPLPGPAMGSSRVSATAQADYRDLRFHAAGGLGEVFLARNAELNREVALKFLKPSRARDPVSLRRFLQEAEVTGRLEHPGVVPIYALGTDSGGTPCYAMRFIRGATFQDAINGFYAAERPGRDPTERSLAIRELLNRFVSICNTVAYAHSRGIIHRDLKPKNIMLGKYDETLVVDWGLAKPFELQEEADGPGEEALTPGSGSDSPTVGVVGTLAYMSPEQARERPAEVGPASDIFSLGAILYAILTGAAPYRSGAHDEVLERVRCCEFPAPRQIKPLTHRALEAICLKAMAREPRDRYANALELAADVKRWLADEPVTAWREPLVLRARRWLRRRRTLMTSTAAVLVFSVIGLAGFTTLVAGKNRDPDAKNLELAGKNQELDRQRLRAEAPESLAIDAVKKFRDAVQGNAELKNRPELDALRKALLTAPMEFFRKLRDQLQADRDTRPEALKTLANANLDLSGTTREIASAADAIRPCTQAIAILERLSHDKPNGAQLQNYLATAHQDLGNLLSETGRPTEAMDSYQGALRIRERLARDHPAVAQYQSDLASNHNQIGILLRDVGRPTEAIDAYQQASRIREQLTRDNPAVASYQNDLADCYHNVANVLSETGHPDEALKSYRRAVVILDQLVHDRPTVSKFQNDLADTYYSIGNRLNDASRYSEALISYRLALEIQERLARDHPAVNVYQNYLAATRNNIGNVLNATGDPTQALKSYRLALEIRERLARDNPSVHSYQGTLGIALRNIAEIEMSQGRWRDAREHLERATERQRGALAAMPHIRLYRERLITTLVDLSKVWRALDKPAEADRVAVEVMRVAREGAELAQRNPGDLYSAACGLALCVGPAPPEQRQALADEAAEMLKQAVAAGWNNAQLTNRDPDLASLHDRDDYRSLVAELFDRSFPAEPFVP